MKSVFVDTAYWLAVTKPRDPWAESAKQAKAELGQVLLVTSDEVLTEFLTAMSKAGSPLRQSTVKMVRTILADPNIRVMAQSRDSFLGALDRYEKREDKRYSLTDCSSMNSMDAEAIKDILTNDHHFQQEGYNVLMKKRRARSRKER